MALPEDSIHTVNTEISETGSSRSTLEHYAKKTSVPAWGGAGMVPGTWGEASVVSEACSGAWGPLPKSSCRSSFLELQSEDLAKHLQERDDLAYCKEVSIPNSSEVGTSKSFVTVSYSADAELTASPNDAAESTDSDFLLAQCLQHEFDLEHDLALELSQRHLNKNSKLSISYDRHKILPKIYSDNSESLPNDDDPVDEIEAAEREEIPMSSRGYVRGLNGLITKHNLNASGWKNTRKMMHNLPPNINTGDAGGFPINLSNRVFNDFNSSLLSLNARKSRSKEKFEENTMTGHMDKPSAMKVLMLRNLDVINDFGSIISTGKESVVHEGTTGCALKTVPENTPCVVKVFSTTMAEFKTRSQYINEDHRFKDRMAKTSNHSNMLKWVEKEYRNLTRTHSVGLPCPQPLHVRDNLLVMSLIGSPGHPAPKLRNIELSRARWTKAYQQTIQIVSDLTYKARLVHADLSEYNLLYFEDQVYVIDFAQAMEISTEDALSFLYRDLCNIFTFFEKRGAEGLKTGLELLEEITQIRILNAPGLTSSEQVEATEHELCMWRDMETNDNKVFEFQWQASQLRSLIRQAKASDENKEKGAADVLEKTGCIFKEQWITKKTDAAVSNKNNKKKKRNRRNSSSKSAPERPGTETDACPLGMDDTSGFCIVETSDCCADTETFAASLPGRQRVHFELTDNSVTTDAGVDTEDYNADADTDFDADTDADIALDCDGMSGRRGFRRFLEGDDTDVAVTETDGDTEGYCGDADDTDQNASDRNECEAVSAVANKLATLCLQKQNEPKSGPTSMRILKVPPIEKRTTKKKPKKSKGKNSVY